MTLLLPNLRRDQKMILKHPAETKVLSMGRRWGKTVLGGTTSLYFASQGARVAWTVPTYKNGRPLWRWAENAVAPLRKSKQADVSRAERVVQFNGGGFLGIYSMDNENSIRGEAFHFVIVDEAARISEEAWTDAIQPTLADYGGHAILISTPNGKNWFWKEWLHGREGRADIHSWQAPTADNPNLRIRRAAELAKDRVSERTYQQEWLAQFVDDGSIFRNVQAQATATEQPAIDGHTYVMGCDWGKYNDYTVLTVIDATTHQVVCLDRFNQIDYHLQLGRVKVLADRYQPDVIIAEKNAMGDPIIEQLFYEHGLPVQPFVTTNASKAKVIDALSLAFERSSLAILNHPVLIGELQAYEAQRLPGGLLRYSAPDGMHDDCVISLALAWYGAQWANPVG